jgi:predicted nuclease of predicted toxin-antitoxin system
VNVRYKLIADANIPLMVVRQLREHGINVLSFVETDKDVTDDEIIKFSQREKGYLLTFDKDLVDEVVEGDYRVEAIILLRFPPHSIAYIVERILRLLKLSDTNLKRNLITIYENRVSLRSLRV